MSNQHGEHKIGTGTVDPKVAADARPVQATKSSVVEAPKAAPKAAVAAGTAPAPVDFKVLFGKQIVVSQGGYEKTGTFLGAEVGGIFVSVERGPTKVIFIPWHAMQEFGVVQS